MNAQSYDATDSVSIHNYDDDLDPDHMDTELLRSEYHREQTEKVHFRNLWKELQERSSHYEAMMQEYERLYTTFLTRSIQAEKDKMDL